MKKVNIGLIGCGAISGIYLQNLQNLFTNTEIVAVADIIEENAQRASKEWGIKVLGVEELINSPDIQILLNLTTPSSHFEINKKALLAGKHTYTEKPLSSKFAEGLELFNIAKEKGLMLGGAPDTFMGAGIQTCRKLIDDGYIGKVFGGVAFYASRGHESWHPNPEFYYKEGGGPMFDMGPYYVTALITLLGSVKEVIGFAEKSMQTRTITSQPKFGQVVDVEVPTTISAVLRFESSAIVNIVTSFDYVVHSHPHIELYGEQGSLLVPDPNFFEGPVKLATRNNKNYMEIPVTHSYAENSRGLGVCDMAKCVLEGRIDNRASGELTLHALEVMEAVYIASKTQSVYKMTTTCSPSLPLPVGLAKGTVDVKA